MWFGDIQIPECFHGGKTNGSFFTYSWWDHWLCVHDNSGILCAIDFEMTWSY